jgi:predicted ATP-grasp superfamily ATP-dependent carboligase
MSLYSRYCSEKFVYTSPYVSIPRFLEDVNANAKRFDATMVFPTSEAAIMACGMARDHLAPELLGPSTEQIELLFDKSKTLLLAQSAGVATPRSQTVTRETMASLSENDVELPAVIKPGRSESIIEDRVVRGGGTDYAYSREELIEKADKMLARTPEVLVQEFIDGYGVGISGIFRNGDPVALFGHRRIRESNPLGGPSAVAVSMSVTDPLYHSTTEIIASTGYTGAAMVEYKIDRESRTPYFMEVNGRLWGSIHLALAAGLDLPYILWHIASDGTAPTESDYVEGVVARNLFGDTKHLVKALKGRPKQWPGPYPSRWRATRDYISLSFSRPRGLLYTTDDPKPAFARVLQEVFS